MRVLPVLVASLGLALGGPSLAETPRGQMKGGVKYSMPAWFKASLLDFKHDVEEARAQGKHVLVFLHLDECPYCERMLRESFVSGDTANFMQKHFDAIGVNVRGELETVWIDGKTYTERTLTRHLGVFATPTLVFLDPVGNKVLQLNGYRDPRALRLALEYVQSKSYGKQSLTDYVAARDKPAVYTLRDHPQFAKTTNFKGYKQPLAVIFEDKQCSECARFHEKTLNHPDVLAELQKFQVVRLDTDSSQPIVKPDGSTTTAAQWAKSLDLSYRPAYALFDEGREIFRMDGRLYHYHFRETLRYVSGGFYRQYDTFSKYSAARREELLKQGIDINYAE